MLQEHTFAVLTRDLAEHGLEQGDVGVVVSVYENDEAYVVEFQDAVLTLPAADVRSKEEGERLHVRSVETK